MPRIIESAEDEDRGWGTKTSPYEYDGRIQDSVQDRIQDSRGIQDRIQDRTLSQPTRLQDIPKKRNPAAKTRKVRELGEIGDLMDIPQPGDVMDGLVPIGDSGLYSVPDDAAAPNDCERWPDSPACGGQVLSTLPIGYEDQEIVADDCNLGFGITPVVGFVKLPKIQLVYRKPECREPPPDYSGKDEWDIYDLPPHYSGLPMPPRPRTCIPQGDDFLCYVGVEIHERRLHKGVETHPELGSEFDQSASRHTPRMGTPIVGSPVTFIKYDDPTISYEQIPTITCEYEYTIESQSYIAVTGRRLINFPYPGGQKTRHDTYKFVGRIYADLSYDYIRYDKDGLVLEGEGNGYKFIPEHSLRTWGQFSDTSRSMFIAYGLYSDISKYLKSFSQSSLESDEYSYPGSYQGQSSTRYDYGIQIKWIHKDGVTIEPPPCNEKPPEPKKKRCCMGCCPPRPGDDSLLRAILAEVKELKKKVQEIEKDIGDPVSINYSVEKNTDNIKDFGFDNKSKKPSTLFEGTKFAVEQIDGINKQLKRLKENNSVLQPKEFIDGKVPKSLLYPGGKGEEKVKGYADLGQIQIRQADKSAGGWPIKIKIADVNAGKKGSQPVDMEVHSIADAMRLILESIIETGGDVDTSTNMLVRLLYTTAQILQTSAATHQIAENVEEWLDYPVKHSKLNVAMVINPAAGGNKGFEKGGKGGLDQNTEKETEKLLPELLQETHYPVRVTEFKGGKTFKDDLTEIRHHVLAISGTCTTPFKGVDALKNLIEAAVLARKIHGSLAKDDVRAALGIGEFDRYSHEVEQGYETTAPARTETVSPYNKPMGQRPKLKRVSKRKKLKPS